MSRYPIYQRSGRLLLATIDQFTRLLPSRSNPSHNPRKILVSNLAHLGDALLTLSILPVLKEAYPSAEIGIIIATPSRVAVEKHPLIKQIHCIDHWKNSRASLSLPKKVWLYIKTRRRVLKEIRSLGYDLAIDCNFHFPNAAFLLWQAAIPERVGFASAGGGPLFTRAYGWDPKENRSAVEAYLSLLPHLAHLYPLNSAGQRRDPLSPIVLHMGSGAAHKLWSEQKWRLLAHHLVNDGHRLIFTGKGEKERKMIENVLFDLPNAASLCDAPWEEFVATIQRAKFLIGVDSCAGHVAAAAQTPALLLFTGIHPPLLWKPYHPAIHTLTHPTRCSPCFTGCSKMHCIQELSVEKVYQVIKSLL